MDTLDSVKVGEVLVMDVWRGIAWPCGKIGAYAPLPPQWRQLTWDDL